jgi:hypothetical protein
MDGMLLSRRQLLAGGLAAGLTASTGCLGLGSDTAHEEAGPELTLSLRRVDGPLRNRYVHDRESIDPRWDEQALEAAINDEQYTTEYRKPFFATPDDPAYFHQEGTYYQLRSVIVDEVTETHPVLRLFEADGTTSTPVDGSREGTLPEADRRAVYRGHLAARARGNTGGFPSGLVERGGYVYRRDAARNESVLLAEDGPNYVSYRGIRYEVRVTQEQFHEPIYRPTAEPVATDPERMESILRVTFVGARTSQTELSSEARQIIAKAEPTDYSETYPLSDAYEELLRALEKRAYIDGNIRNDAELRATRNELIQYEDRYYEHSLQITNE